MRKEKKKKRRGINLLGLAPRTFLRLQMHAVVLPADLLVRVAVRPRGAAVPMAAPSRAVMLRGRSSRVKHAFEQRDCEEVDKTRILGFFLASWRGGGWDGKKRQMGEEI